MGTAECPTHYSECGAFLRVKLLLLVITIFHRNRGTVCNAIAGIAETHVEICGSVGGLQSGDAVLTCLLVRLDDCRAGVGSGGATSENTSPLR